MRTKSLGRQLGVVTLLAFGIGACEKAPQPVAELEVRPETVELGHPLFARAVLDWRMLSDLEGATGEVRVFLHLEDQTGTLVRTFDHDLPLPWRAGDRGEYEVILFQSALAAPLAEGRYVLTAGLYDSADGRWPLAGRVSEVRPGEYRVAEVVAQGPGLAPRTYFSAGWSPVEEGSDLQVLGRRRMGESGSVRLADLPGPGELWLQIGIPRVAAGESMVLDDGAAAAAVRMTTTCGEYQTEIAGAGGHAVLVPIEPGEDGTCDLEFTTNFYVLSADGQSRQTVTLEGLAWSAAEGDRSP